jgi:hypothetical protein
VRAGRGYLSHKRAHNTIIQHDENAKVDGNVTTPPSPSVSLPLLATPTGRGALHPSQPGSVSHSLWIKPVSLDNFDGDRSKGHAFFTSCELYLSLTGSDYPDKQSRIHWALSFFKSGHAATFAE